jgi:hypothetical protein
MLTLYQRILEMSRSKDMLAQLESLSRSLSFAVL